MTASIKTRHSLGIIGLAGFLLCAWFGYQCGLGARDSASQAYTLWVSGSQVQAQAASRQNGLWVLAVGGSAVLGLLFLSVCFCSNGAAIRRRGMGLLMLCG